MACNFIYTFIHRYSLHSIPLRSIPALSPLIVNLCILSPRSGHGITQIVNNGLLYYGQPGALNEGFSDMIGMTYIFYKQVIHQPLTVMQPLVNIRITL